MIGGLNKPKSNPSPNSGVISQAIDLLAAFGGKNKALSDLLTEMKEVQEYNEGVVKSAAEIYNKVQEAYSKLTGELEQFKKNIKEQENQWKEKYAELSSRERKMSYTQKTNLERESERAETIAKRTSYVSEKEIEVEQKSRVANLDLAKVEAGRIKNEKAGKLLDNREKNLNYVIDRLKDVLGNL